MSAPEPEPVVSGEVVGRPDAPPSGAWVDTGTFEPPTDTGVVETDASGDVVDTGVVETDEAEPLPDSEVEDIAPPEPAPALNVHFQVVESASLRRSFSGFYRDADWWQGSWHRYGSEESSSRERFVADGVIGLMTVGDGVGTQTCAWSATRLEWGRSGYSRNRYWGQSYGGTWFSSGGVAPLVAQDLWFDPACGDIADYFPRGLTLAPGPAEAGRAVVTSCHSDAIHGTGRAGDFLLECGAGAIGVPFASIYGAYSDTRGELCEQSVLVVHPVGGSPQESDLTCTAPPGVHYCSFSQMQTEGEPWYSESWTCSGLSFSVEDELTLLGPPGW